jgi:hypothetical protein
MNVGMIFALLAALLLIGFLLAFGLGAIGGLFSVNEQGQVQKAVKDLEAVVGELYYRTPGNSQVVDLMLPGSASVCFVNSSESRVYSERWKSWTPSQDIRAVLEVEGYNVWYYWSGGNGGYRMAHLEAPDSFCAVSGTRVYLESRGLTVSVEPA